MTWAFKLIEKAFAVYLNAELYVGDILKVEGKKVDSDKKRDKV